MTAPRFRRRSSQPSGSNSEPDGCGLPCAHSSTDATATDATNALWQYLERIEHGLDLIDARIDRLYIALGGGTVLLAAIGLSSAFIVRGG